MSYRTAVLLQALAAVLLSTGGLLVKIVTLHPLALAGGRGLVAAIVIGIYATRRRRLHFTWSIAQVGGGLALLGAQVFFVLATRETTAANAIFIQFTAPVYVALFGIWFLREPARRVDWLAIGAIGVGLYLFFGDGLQTSGMKGNFYALLAGISYAWYVLFMRKQRTGSTVETVLLGNLFAGLVGLPFLLRATPTAGDWAGVLFLGFFQIGLPCILLSITIKHLTAVEAILIQTLEPLLNPVWVFLVIGEQPGPLALLGGLIVLATVTARSLIVQQRRVPVAVRSAAE